jgi:hypothetical protein
MNKLFSCLIATALLASALPAHAVKTERWEIATPTDFLRGKLDRLTLTSDGQLRPGYASAKLGEFAKEIWCSITAPDGTIYFGTGTPADIHAYYPDGAIARLLQTDAIAITSLALDSQGNLYAATLADGKIYKLPAAKPPAAEGAAAAKPFCILRSPYIWSIVTDRQDHIFAATGPDGKIIRISPDAKTEDWYIAEESNILCLALAADGTLYAGGSDRGLLYRVTAKSKADVLHQFTEDEIKSIIVDGDALFIAVNRQKNRRSRGAESRRPTSAAFDELTQQISARFGARVTMENARPSQETPADSRIANMLTGSLYHRAPNGRMDRLAVFENEGITHIALDHQKQILLATAHTSRIYRITSPEQWELLFDLDEKQALTIALRNGRLALIGTGNIGNAYTVSPETAPTGTYTSEIRDCRFFTAWGNLSWNPTGPVTLATRTGNTTLPDTTWSAWSQPAAQPPMKITSPHARFIQVRAELTTAPNPLTCLRAITLHYHMQNQRPEITAVTVTVKTPPPTPPTEKPKQNHPAATTPDMDPSALENALTATEAGTLTPSAQDFRPQPANTKKQITWRATDNDSDTLTFELHYQPTTAPVWLPFPIEKPLKQTSYTWDTESFPDGYYRIRVTASDKDSNPPGQSLSAERTTEPVRVDNRRPEIVNLTFDPLKHVLTGTARDTISNIHFLEYSLNGADWKYFAPADGIFDDREEPFTVNLTRIAPATYHHIAIRATDEAGNVGVEKLAFHTH